jgi:hypothetical protein
VVKPAFVREQGRGLSEKRRTELAGRALPADLTAFSPLRKISLAGLEQACRQYAEKGQPVPPELRYLAGLQRIEYVFADPDGHDVIIAGPAEGFLVDASGKATGVGTRRSVLRLDDLLVALRSQERGDGRVRCSIDPTPEGLARLNRFLQQTSGAMTAGQAKAKFAQLGKQLGPQVISVSGVPAESHFSWMLVEADIRMKRLSIGVDPAPIKGFQSYLQLVQKNEESLQRWWFAPFYQAFVQSADKLAYQFAGQRVQLLAQQELLGPQGQRTDAPFTSLSSEKFAQQFTRRFEEIAAAVPVFAELQNAFDLLVFAALLKKERLPQQVGWRPSLLLDPQAAPTERDAVPKQTDSVSNYKVLNQSLYIAQVSGGVVIDPFTLLNRHEYSSDSTGELARRREGALQRPTSETPRWWWDGASTVAP